MSDTRHRAITHCAHWGWDEHQFWGHPVFGELLGNEGFMGLTALSVTGRRLSADCCAVLDDAAVALAMADPRIWPVKLARVVASHGRTLPACAAALVSMEGARIGPHAFIGAARGLSRFKSLLPNPDDDAAARSVFSEHLSKHGMLWGFGTPFRARDERFVAFRARVVARGRHRHVHWRTMEAIVGAANTLCHASPNISLAVAAVCLDMGFSDTEVGAMAVSLMQHMFLANALEESAEPDQRLRRLPVACVEYVGPPPRRSPRAEREDGA